MTYVFHVMQVNQLTSIINKLTTQDSSDSSWEVLIRCWFELINLCVLCSPEHPEVFLVTVNKEFCNAVISAPGSQPEIAEAMCIGSGLDRYMAGRC